MSNRELTIAIAVGAAAIAGAVVWSGSAVRGALLESHRGPAHPAEPETNANTPNPGLAQTPAPTAETPRPPSPTRIEFGNDTFTQAFTGEPGQRAERECWSKAPAKSPDALFFLVGLDATGKVVKAEPEVTEREGEVNAKLYACVGGVIRSMKFSGITHPAELRVQASRPARK